MLFWLSKSVILSLLLISIIHYLYIFLKKNLTQPKIKDLIDHPKKEYEDILQLINKRQPSEVSSSNNTTNISDLPDTDYEPDGVLDNNMQDELSKFLLEETDTIITTQNEGEYNNFSFNIN